MENHKKNFKVFLDDLKNDPRSQKALFESIALWLQRKDEINIKFVGTDEQISVVKEAIVKTKKFQDSLFNKDATLEEVFSKLSNKHFASDSFKNAFGISWVL
jgi:hypothetical protein